jgi:SH3-like domain-containing protein
MMIEQIQYIRIVLFICIFLCILPIATRAEERKLPLPRFASIKSNEVNARVGPTIKSSIEWVFIKKGEPVEIIEEYEQWRQIRDIKGEGGWVHSSVLSGKKSVIVISEEIVPLTKQPNSKSKIIAKISKDVRCLLNKCEKNYCQVCCNNYTGWLPKKILWGTD